MVLVMFSGWACLGPSFTMDSAMTQVPCLGMNYGQPQASPKFFQSVFLGGGDQELCSKVSGDMNQLSCLDVQGEPPSLVLLFLDR